MLVSISRSNGVNVITGEGLAEALEGIEVIIDTATQESSDQTAATEFFKTSAAQPRRGPAPMPGVERIVVISIIGIDAFEGGYNAAKLAQERGAASTGPLPVRILRASQFHEFVAQLVEWTTRDGVNYRPRVPDPADRPARGRRGPRRPRRGG